MKKTADVPAWWRKGKEDGMKKATKKVVYAIRWAKRVDGEEESGVFDTCYTDRKAAEAVLRKDVDETKAEWTRNYEGYEVEFRELDGYFSVAVPDIGTYDYCEWWLDELEVK